MFTVDVKQHHNNNKNKSLYTGSVRDKQQFFFDTMNICLTPNSPNIMQTDS